MDLSLEKFGIDNDRDRKIAATGMAAFSAATAFEIVGALDATGIALAAYVVGLMVSRQKGDEHKLTRICNGLMAAGLSGAALALLPWPAGVIAAAGLGYYVYRSK